MHHSIPVHLFVFLSYSVSSTSNPYTYSRAQREEHGETILA